MDFTLVSHLAEHRLHFNSDLLVIFLLFKKEIHFDLDAVLIPAQPAIENCLGQDGLLLLFYFIRLSPSSHELMNEFKIEYSFKIN